MILEYNPQKLHVKVVLLESFASGLLETLSGLTENKYSKCSSAEQKHSNRGRIYTNIWTHKEEPTCNISLLSSILCLLYAVLFGFM